MKSVVKMRKLLARAHTRLKFAFCSCDATRCTKTTRKHTKWHTGSEAPATHQDLLSGYGRVCVCVCVFTCMTRHSCQFSVLKACVLPNSFSFFFFFFFFCRTCRVTCLRCNSRLKTTQLITQPLGAGSLGAREMHTHTPRTAVENRTSCRQSVPRWA